MGVAERDSIETILLKEVSRSFYLTLRILPASIRPQISLAYLLARATDTIADTDMVPIERRLQALDQLRNRILDEQTGPLDFTLWLQAPAKSKAHADQVGSGSSSERRLLERVEVILETLSRFAPEDQASIRQVLQIIAGGQILDLRRFGFAGASTPTGLESEADLDDYTYRVAGCVGEFWTQLCRRHAFPNARVDDTALLRDSVRFGKGLQLVNILRDLPSDLRQGRCYLPAEDLRTVRLTPPDLLDPEKEPIVRPVYNKWLDRAQSHLEAGWFYTCALPRKQRRLRLACAWPLLIGTKTLAQLRHRPCLDPHARIKVSRPEVRSILIRSILLLPFPRTWEAQFQARSNSL